jgi:hypothetical protein
MSSTPPLLDVNEIDSEISAAHEPAHGEHRADNMGEPNKTTVAEAAAGTREHHNPVPTPRLDSAESKRVRSKRNRVRFSPVQ